MGVEGHIRKQNIFFMNPNIHTKCEINMQHSFEVIAHIIIIEHGK